MYRNGRLHCAVVFCDSTRGDRKGDPISPGMVWICGKHWRHVSRIKKRRLKLADRMWHKFKDKDKAAAMRWATIAHKVWDSMVAEANEAAAGIG